MVTHSTPADLRPFAPSEIDARVLRQRALLARIRDVDDTSSDVLTERVHRALSDGQGREDLFAALWIAAARDDVYDALAQQRQAEVLREKPYKIEGRTYFLEGLLRIGFVAPAMVATVETIMEAAIAKGDSRGSAYDMFLVWAGACRHAWLWEILQAAHKHSLVSRRASP